MAPPPISHSTALIGAHQVTPMSLPRASSFFRAAPHMRGDEVLE
jgi:hypothetical protein